MTSDRDPADSPEPEQAFSQQADLPQVGFWWEFAEFLLHNKKWWLIPLLLVLALLTLFAFLGSSPLAPFIYPIF